MSPQPPSSPLAAVALPPAAALLARPTGPVLRARHQVPLWMLLGSNLAMLAAVGLMALHFNRQLDEERGRAEQQEERTLRLEQEAERQQRRAERETVEADGQRQLADQARRRADRAEAEVRRQRDRLRRTLCNAQLALVVNVRQADPARARRL